MLFLFLVEVVIVQRCSNDTCLATSCNARGAIELFLQGFREFDVHRTESAFVGVSRSGTCDDTVLLRVDFRAGLATILKAIFALFALVKF